MAWALHDSTGAAGDEFAPPAAPWSEEWWGPGMALEAEAPDPPDPPGQGSGARMMMLRRRRLRGRR